MRQTIVTLSLVVAVAAASCTKNTSEPSNSTTTTSTTSTTSSTTSVTTTSIPATFAVRGRVTSEKTGEALPFADIEIIQGTNVGKRFQGDNGGNYTMPNLTPGTFVTRYWATGYLVKDVTITITNADVTQNVQLTPVPPTTTTTSALNAAFTFSPNPCTIAPGPTINCTVDSGSSTGDITKREWLYAGKTVVDQVTHALSFACGDLQGSGSVRTISVRLNVYDAQGNVSTVDSGIPVQINGGACP